MMSNGNCRQLNIHSTVNSALKCLEQIQTLKLLGHWKGLNAGMRNISVNNVDQAAKSLQPKKNFQSMQPPEFMSPDKMLQMTL